jgi:hypothetical protein
VNKDLETASNNGSEPSERRISTSSTGNPHDNRGGTAISNKNPNNPSNNNLSNVQTGLFVTSYNKLVSSVTSGNVVPRNNNFFVREEDVHRYMDLPYQDEHLEVRTEDQKRIVEDVFQDIPRGEDADTVLSVTATSPHISAIVDHSITLKPGAELFTMVLGPTKSGWKPFGTTHTFEEGGRALDESNPSGKTTNTPAASGKEKKNTGWPIFMQTAPGVKFLVKVPKTEVNVNIPSLFRFLLAHFADLPQLKAYLESCKRRRKIHG